MSTATETMTNPTPQIQPMTETNETFCRFREAAILSLFVNIDNKSENGELTAADAFAALATMPKGSNDYHAYGLEPQEYFQDWASRAVWDLLDDLATNAQNTHDQITNKA